MSGGGQVDRMRTFAVALPSAGRFCNSRKLNGLWARGPVSVVGLVFAMSGTMLWPRTPVDRLQSFRPPFCPHRDCPEHVRTRPGYRCRRHGFYRNARGRRIRRFRCSTCLGTFCCKTFAATYYLKRPELLLPVAALLHAGAAHRQIARSLGCAPSTVTRLSARLGRHALLLLTHALASLDGRLDETVVLDHFEVFEFSQDLPFGVGRRSAVSRECSTAGTGSPPSYRPTRDIGCASPTERRSIPTRPNPTIEPATKATFSAPPWIS